VSTKAGRTSKLAKKKANRLNEVNLEPGEKLIGIRATI
jgi:hypothetical protein